MVIDVKPEMQISSRTHLSWPFFNESHRAYVEELDRTANGLLDGLDTEGDVNSCCVELVRRLGARGLLNVCVPAPYGGKFSELSARHICLTRQRLGYLHALADFAFAMQGLGSGAISLAGSEAQKALILPKVASGEWIAAFALSEENAGSDVAALSTAAQRDGESYVLNGEKMWISNGGIADIYVLFARTGDAPGSRGLSAFIVYPTDPGFEIAENIRVMSPHPLARVRLSNCHIPVSRRIGASGEGFKIAMRTLDVFRTSVAAAALGFAERALDEAVRYSTTRKMFGGVQADLQLTQAKLGDMATLIESSSLLTYRAAWMRDTSDSPATREVAMAKMAATENAQTVIDTAVQILGGRGVVSGAVVEALYRDIRALRIYEGATEVQKLIIARDLLKGAAAQHGA